MGSIVDELLKILGLDVSVVPQNLAEFMPYFFKGILAFCVVACFLGWIKTLSTKGRL